jgi:hypothetical protein
MSNNPKTNRDAGSGKYVSQDYADQHKDTTVSETEAKKSTAEAFLKKLDGGGAIVSSKDLSEEDLAAVPAEMFYVDSDGRGYVYVPIEE